MAERDYIDQFDTIVFVVSPGPDTDKWLLTIDDEQYLAGSPSDVLWKIIKSYIGFVEER